MNGFHWKLSQHVTRQMIVADYISEQFQSCQIVAIFLIHAGLAVALN